MRDDGNLRIAAILAAAGLGERWLNARWHDDRAVLIALAHEIDDLEEERMKGLANLITGELVRSGAVGR